MRLRRRFWRPKTIDILAYESGVFTEDYLNLVLLERQRRCPLSLFLQLYGSMFVTSNALVAAIFSLGILSSLLSAVQGTSAETCGGTILDATPQGMAHGKRGSQHIAKSCSTTI
eukprot:s729_g17.t1